jgi:glycine/D-amino acid oxidase-like deaminating enzyme
MFQVDVLIYGGGVAGLWTHAVLRHAGYRALLLEKRALGAGQTIQSQGIIHGGFKYAIPGVKDMDSTSAIREMPARWKQNLEGLGKPDLSRVTVHSRECLFWLPSGKVTEFIGKAGLKMLHSKPRNLPKTEWPEILSGAGSVYAVPEPVLDTGSLLRALADGGEGWIKLDEPGVFQVDAKVKVLTAGAGNAQLLHRFRYDAGIMQRRPLSMLLLRGALPRIYGHCVEGGKTALTITSHPWQGGVVWQIGGEIAEKYANESDYARVRKGAVETLKSHFPGLRTEGLQVATYRAVRAEARTKQGRRPSGAQVVAVAPDLIVAWPTKLALAPVMAEGILNMVSRIAKPSRAAEAAPPNLPDPPLAPYPWEQAEWFSAG